MQAYAHPGPMGGLPDPEADRDFYEGIVARRLVAWCIDLLVVLGIGVPVAVFFGLATLGLGFAVFPVVVAGIGFLYRTATLSSRSATWGMRFAGIEFRRGDGTRFDFLTALLHTGIASVCLSVVVLQFVSCAAILATRYRQALPDIILGTTAIHRPAE